MEVDLPHLLLDLHHHLQEDLLYLLCLLSINILRYLHLSTPGEHHLHLLYHQQQFHLLVLQYHLLLYNLSKDLPLDLPIQHNHPQLYLQSSKVLFKPNMNVLII